ncbi:MAG: nucleoside hydrolase [Erysipelotrichaceae bacterium]|jgi:pyrimidine-specific ribonucleoside hydrolase|nr:nucleoside hydrolase [Erysipelotrichaceae bacterium]
MRKVIIDTDPGHDDIMAILTALAHSSELELLSFCTVAGNQTVDKVTNNILKVEEYLGINIPVYRGEERPMVKDPQPQPQAHGETGMDGPILPEPLKKAEELSAVEYYKQILEKEDKVTIIALAPLTNLGVLLSRYPHLSEKIEAIALMGGALDGGNINKCAEFNIWHDPEAAKIVFDSGIRVIMAPLEACYAGAILLSETERFRKEGRVSKLVDDLFGFYCRYAIERNWDRTSVFDLMPVLYLLDEDLFVSEKGKVDIILDGEDTQGQTVFTKGEGNHIVLVDADREACMKIFFDAIDLLDRRYQ